MKYQVFARKYRPQTFDEIVGQDHVVRTLKNAIEQDRLAQAYLFVGPRGTGKTSTARIFAKALNCVNGPTINPCGKCDQCLEIATGRSMNVLEFDAASNTQVDKIREIILDTVQYAPSSGRVKLYIVDEVHMLSNASFNALLKTLEEPPAHVKFVFATTEPQKVPTTILSRCQRFDLRRIPATLIADHLKLIAGKEKITISEEAVSAVAKAAEGGLRDAESMLDQLVSFCGNEIAEEDVLHIFGLTAQKTVADLCGHILNGSASDALALVHAQSESGRDLSRLLTDCIEHLRNLLIAKADPGALEADPNSEMPAIIAAQAAQIPMDRLLEWIDQFAEAGQRMKNAPNKKLHFEVAVIKAIQALGQATLTDVLDTLTAIRSGGEIREPQRVIQNKTQNKTSLEDPVQKTAPAKSASPSAETKTSKTESESAAEKAIQEPAQFAKEPAKKLANDDLPAAEKSVSENPKSADRTTSAIPESKKIAEPDAVSSEEKPESIAESSPLKLANSEPEIASPTVQEIPSELSKSEPEPEPQKAAAAEIKSPTESPAQNESANRDLWIALLRSARPLLKIQLKLGTLLSVEDDVFLLGFPSEQTLAVKSIERPNNKEFIEEKISEIAGRPLRLKCEMREGLEVASVTLPEEKSDPKRDPMEDFKKDPLIQKALEIFKAEIQPA